MTRHQPEHVPAEFVVDLDIYNLPAQVGDDATARWQAFFGGKDLVWSPYNGGHWVVTKGEDISRFLRDSGRFSSRQVNIPAADVPLVPIESDGKAHAAYRRNILPFFLPKAVAAMEGTIRERAIGFIEEIRARGECEFITGFAEQLPIVVFLGMMGLPAEDRKLLHGLTRSYVEGATVEEKNASFIGQTTYLKDYIDARRREPRDDAISMLVHGELDGRPYTEEELLSTCVMLLQAGLGTVASSLGFWTLHLARHPKDRDYIRSQKDDLGPVIIELMRRFGVPSLGRVLNSDVEYAGTVMREGDRILLSPVLFNQDERLFPDPTMVDFNRPMAKLQTAVPFGTGPHFCPGAPLARVEFTVFLQEWLTRIPNFRLKPEKELVMVTGGANAVHEMWLQW